MTTCAVRTNPASSQTPSATASADPADLAFQLHALASAANGSYQLYRDPAVFRRTRRLIEALLAPA